MDSKFDTIDFKSSTPLKLTLNEIS